MSMYSYFCVARQSDKLEDHLKSLKVNLTDVLNDFQKQYKDLPASMTAFFEEEKNVLSYFSQKELSFFRTKFSSNMTQAELSFALRDKISRWTIETKSCFGDIYSSQEITFSSPNFKFIRSQLFDETGAGKETSYRYWDISMNRATFEKNKVGLYLMAKQKER